VWRQEWEQIAQAISVTEQDSLHDDGEQNKIEPSSMLIKAAKNDDRSYDEG
jgi:hypothetical protein